MFTIEMLPAARGDCLWIEYGAADAPRRVLIDGGLISTYRNHLRAKIEALPETKRQFDLLVITHIDLDHIAGILALLRDPPAGLSFDDVWFNAWQHLPEDVGELGAKQGEAVSYWLEQRGYAWNRLFGGAAVCIPRAAETLPTKTLRGGMDMTLLSPTPERLVKLRTVWKAEIEGQGLEPGNAGSELEGIAHPEDVSEEDEGLLGTLNIEDLAESPFRADTSPANGSSIALLAEYDGRRAVLTGDAYASDVLASIRRLADAEDDESLAINALKLSHHGGKKNTSRELLERLRCDRYLFSTDGSSYNHPDPESVARAVVHGGHAGRPSLIFNYRSEETEMWDDSDLFGGDHPYEPEYPGAQGCRVDL